MNKKLFLIFLMTCATTALWAKFDQNVVLAIKIANLALDFKTRHPKFNFTKPLKTMHNAQKTTDDIIKQALDKEHSKHQWQTSTSIRDALNKITFRTYFL